MCKEYNGYTNYETWCINLWIDNDQGLYDEVRSLAHESKSPYELANMIKDLVEELNPVQDASMFGDLMQSAIDNCNFDEIADNIYEELEPEEEAEVES